MPLFIYSLWGGHTDAHIHTSWTKSILETWCAPDASQCTPGLKRQGQSEAAVI